MPYNPVTGLGLVRIFLILAVKLLLQDVEVRRFGFRRCVGSNAAENMRLVASEVASAAAGPEEAVNFFSWVSHQNNIVRLLLWLLLLLLLRG